MERKFKTGDVISRIDDLFEEHKYEIIAVVEGLSEFEGDWISSGEQRKFVLDSYLIKVCEFSGLFSWKLATIAFNEEKFFRCICGIGNSKMEWNAICTCGAPAFVSLFSKTCSKGCSSQY